MNRCKTQMNQLFVLREMIDSEVDAMVAERRAPDRE